MKKLNYKVVLVVGMLIATLLIFTACGNEGGTFDSTKAISKENVFLFLPYQLVRALVYLFQGHYWLAIIFGTIIIRTLLWPIYAKSNNMQNKMQEMQPEIQALEQKYAGRTDQESQRMKQMEMMGIYKNHGMNLLGCLLPFLQFPVFLAMYQVMVRLPMTFQDRGEGANITTKFLFWDLADSPILKDGSFILPIMVGLLMLLQFYVTNHISKKRKANAPKTQSNPQAEQMQSVMKIMMLVFPVFMVIVTFQASLALSLYWIVGTSYSTGQMLISKKPWRKDDNTIDVTKNKKKPKGVR